jgi:hypothetical protein
VNGLDQAFVRSIDLECQPTELVAEERALDARAVSRHADADVEEEALDAAQGLDVAAPLGDDAGVLVAWHGLEKCLKLRRAEPRVVEREHGRANRVARHPQLGERDAHVLKNLGVQKRDVLRLLLGRPL